MLGFYLMHFGHEPIFQYLAQYAYEPGMVYVGVFVMMLASAFGLPLPEEVTIISVGVLAYMGAHPDLFPPPFPGAPVINGYEVAIFTFLAVMISDGLVFMIGRTGGRKLMMMPRFRGFFEGPVMDRINGFVRKYGIYAAFIFRFTPGIRFPAHLFLGMSKFSFVAFMIVDGVAAAISVPTQILLVYHYGEEILSTMYKFKKYVAMIIAVIILFLLARKIYFYFKNRKLRAIKEEIPKQLT